MQMTTVLLSQLQIDPANVRKTDAEPDATLIASIGSHGILIPLLTRKSGDIYLVKDGGKRLRALNILAKDGQLDPDFTVPISVLDVDDATARDQSLTANFVREDMHPIDVYEAFTDLVQGGKAPADIAREYGLPQKLVNQHLALGKLAPEVRAAWRDGQLDEEVAEAFTLEPDLKRQATILKKVGKHSSAWQIRREIVGEAHEASGLLRLVGLDAYKAAGGVTTEDLFTDAKTPELIATDVKLLKKLADDKIASTVERLKGEGWKWVSDGSDLPDSARYWDGKPKSQIKADDRSKFGVIVRRHHTGELDIKYGVQKPSEKKATEKKVAAAGDDDGVAGSNVTLSSALCGRLSTQMTTAAEEVLALSPNLALAAIAAALTAVDGPVCIHRTHGGGGSDSDDFAYQLTQFRKKKPEEIAALLAGIVASALNLGGCSQQSMPLAEGRDEDRVLLEALDPKKLNAELRANFDAADYFGSVTREACVIAIKEIDGKQPIDPKAKKSDLAKLAADLSKKSNAGRKAGYLPPEMRTTHYDGPSLKKALPAPAAKATPAKAAKKKAR